MIPLAHIAGVPVEETIGMFAPAIVALGIANAGFRSRLRALRAWRPRSRNPKKAQR